MSAASPASELHARTVPLEYGPDALQFDGSPTVLFDRPGLTLVGWGTAVLVGASAATDLLAAIPCDDMVGRTGTGVVALGALPFDDAMAGHLIVPARGRCDQSRSGSASAPAWRRRLAVSSQPCDARSG